MILDFSLTLLFNHLVLTTYYSASLPSSLFFYLVTLMGTAIMVILGEQLCVKREMREGLNVVETEQRSDVEAADEDAENMEMGALLSRRD